MHVKYDMANHNLVRNAAKSLVNSLCLESGHPEELVSYSGFLNCVQLS